MLKNSNNNRVQNLKILGFSVVSYTCLSLFLDKSISPQIMFDSFNLNADSVSYLKVGQWLLGGEFSEHVAFRPFLFPAIIALLFQLGGALAIWMFQFAAYIIGHFFLHKAIKLMTENTLLAWVGSFLYIINFSLIGLTFHALTEVLTVCGLSIASYLVVLHLKDRVNQAFFWSWIIFVLAVLTLIKPVFMLPFYFVVLTVFVLVLAKRIPFKKLLKWPLVFAFIGVITQLALMKTTFGEVNISQVSGKTYKNYLLAQVLVKTENIERNEAVLHANDFNQSELKKYSYLHADLILFQFLENLRENIQSDSFIQDYIHPSVNEKPAIVMRYFNQWTLYFHLFILLFGLVFFIVKTKRETIDLIIPFAFLWLLLEYYVFVTGISFAQRDRLVIGALPLLIFFLMVFTNELMKIRQKKQG